MDITKDSKKLLLLMYKEYQRRRANGMDRRAAMNFNSAEAVHDLLLPKEDGNDVLDYLWELKRAGYIEGLDADNTLYTCYLTTKAIMTLEQLPADVLKSVAEFIGNFIP